MVIPKALVSSTRGRVVTLGDVQERLEAALESAGYSEKSYFAVPSGFAIVTRLEQFSEEGASKDGAERWATEVAPLTEFSLGEYISALFRARPGYFRVIVFVVTPVAFSKADALVTRDEAIRWLNKGANKLPPNLTAKRYTDQYDCTALVYEFAKPSSVQSATLRVPGALSVKEHLVKAHLWQALER
jgi:hypothetical protein